MGVWTIATDRIQIGKEVDDILIKEFIIFSDISCPKSYCREKFCNLWFFDEKNRLICHAGKFAEPEVWYEHLKEYFFAPYRHFLPDEIHYLGECEEGFERIARRRSEEYQVWKQRMEHMDVDTIYNTKYNLNRSIYV